MVDASMVVVGVMLREARETLSTAIDTLDDKLGRPVLAEHIRHNVLVDLDEILRHNGLND